MNKSGNALSLPGIQAELLTSCFSKAVNFPLPQHSQHLFSLLGISGYQVGVGLGAAKEFLLVQDLMFRHLGKDFPGKLLSACKFKGSDKAVALGEAG